MKSLSPVMETGKSYQLYGRVFKEFPLSKANITYWKSLEDEYSFSLGTQACLTEANPLSLWLKTDHNTLDILFLKKMGQKTMPVDKYYRFKNKQDEKQVTLQNETSNLQLKHYCQQ